MEDLLTADVDRLPPELRELMVMFPPLCRVVANRALKVPGPGRVGRVTQWYVRDDDCVVIVQDEAAFFHKEIIPAVALKPRACAPEWLTVLQYDGNKTPDWMRAALAGVEGLEPRYDPGLDGVVEGVIVDERPEVWVLRLDEAQPVAVPFDEVKLEQNSLLFHDNGRRVPVSYVQSIQAAEG